MGITVTGTDFITVPTQDFDRARAFYGTTLGLRFGKQWGSMPGAEYETGNLTLALMESKAFGLEFAPNSVQPIAFRVDDVAKRRAELEAKGVVFDGATITTGVCKQAWFKDPDGNALMLHRRFDV